MDKISTFLAQSYLYFQNLKSKSENKVSNYISKGENVFLKVTKLFIITFSIPIIFTLISFRENMGFTVFFIALTYLLFISVFFWHHLNIDTKEKIHEAKRISEKKTKPKGIFLDSNLIYERFYLLFGKHNYIDEERTSVQDFINVLTLPFNSHDSIIYFNLSNRGVKLVIERFRKLNPSLTLISVESSSHFHSNNGQLRDGALRKAKKPKEKKINEINSNLDSIFTPFMVDK
ncbi:hypothetical protein [Joostella sp. CR20]|uniref:hypothetical protein n=1 Tax=Joostella sp. CR20 TaxID=2804312 RepID=UPI00313D95E7